MKDGDWTKLIIILLIFFMLFGGARTPRTRPQQDVASMQESTASDGVYADGAESSASPQTHNDSMTRMIRFFASKKYKVISWAIIGIIVTLLLVRWFLSADPEERKPNLFLIGALLALVALWQFFIEVLNAKLP